MLTLYIGCLAAGGLLLIVSMIGGGDSDTDSDMDHDLSADSDADMDHDLSADSDADMDHDLNTLDSSHAISEIENAIDTDGTSMAEAAFLPFLSLRFWTFFTTFFGLTGTIFNITNAINNNTITLSLSLAIGCSTGYIASKIIHTLKRKQSDSTIRLTDYAGCSGKVLLPISSSQKGKVRVSIKGSFIDLIAVSEENENFVRGDEVIVLSIENETAKIVNKNRLMK